MSTNNDQASTTEAGSTTSRTNRGASAGASRAGVSNSMFGTIDSETSTDDDACADPLAGEDSASGGMKKLRRFVSRMRSASMAGPANLWQLVTRDWLRIWRGRKRRCRGDWGASQLREKLGLDPQVLGPQLGEVVGDFGLEVLEKIRQAAGRGRSALPAIGGGPQPRRTPH